MQCKECKDIAPPLDDKFVYWECSCFKNQPERLNPKDIKPFDGILSPDWVVNLVNVCDSPTTENK